MADQSIDGERQLTPDQQVLGAGVRALLRDLHVSHTEALEANRGESWYRFNITTPPGSDLRVDIAIVSDVVVLTANGVQLRWDLNAWTDVSAWIAASLDGLAVVFRNELRLRLRRTVFGGTAGAICFPGATQGTWNGDGRAARGEGREYMFPAPWYLVE